MIPFLHQTMQPRPDSLAHKAPHSLFAVKQFSSPLYRLELDGGTLVEWRNMENWEIKFPTEFYLLQHWQCCLGYWLKELEIIIPPYSPWQIYHMYLIAQLKGETIADNSPLPPICHSYSDDKYEAKTFTDGLEYCGQWKYIQYFSLWYLK